MRCYRVILLYNPGFLKYYYFQILCLLSNLLCSKFLFSDYNRYSILSNLSWAYFLQHIIYQLNIQASQICWNSVLQRSQTNFLEKKTSEVQFLQFPAILYCTLTLMRTKYFELLQQFLIIEKYCVIFLIWRGILRQFLEVSFILLHLLGIQLDSRTFVLARTLLGATFLNSQRRSPEYYILRAFLSSDFLPLS